MLKDFVKYIQEDEDILYGYFLPPDLFGLTSGVDKYVLITKYAYKLPDKYKDIPIIHFPIQLYFKYITNNDLTAWILSCLDKKYIIKEHVRLLVNFDILKIRKNIDDTYKLLSDLLYRDFDVCSITEIKAVYSKIYKYLVYANQVIDNHKIINYHVVGPGLEKINQIKTGYINDCYSEVIKPEMNMLIAKTELLRKKEILKKLKNEM